MAITPADIENMTFSQAGKHEEGYKTDEVDVFLDQLASEVDAMLQKIADLKGRLTKSEQQVAAAQAQIAQLKEQGSAPVVTEVAAPASDGAITASERQISQVLIVAQQSADKLVADARANADNIRNEADQKAREVIRQALGEKQKELDEIDRLKQSREDFRSEYKKLLQHFMDDADSVFPQHNLGTAAAANVPVPAPAPVTPTPAPPVVDSGATTFAPAPGDFSDLD